MLKSKGGWNNGGNGMDSFGFAALPAGYYGYRHDYPFNSFFMEGDGASFWSSTEQNANEAFELYLYSYEKSVGLSENHKYNHYSVRCLRNSDSAAESSQKPDDVTYLTDTRDGQKYKTVKIGKQVWMAQNLNYEKGKSWCYGNYYTNCQKYGRLYNWESAMEVCPAGWHLPSKSEFETLVSAVGGFGAAGLMLKSGNDWIGDGGGLDSYGFSALPAGGRRGYGYSGFDDSNIRAYFWSSSKNSRNSNDAYYFQLNRFDDSASVDNGGLGVGFSVRCLKNN